MRYSVYYKGRLDCSLSCESIWEAVSNSQYSFNSDLFIKCDEDDQHVANLFLALNEMVASNLNIALTSSNEFLRTYAENCVKNKGALEHPFIPSTPDQNRYCLNGWIQYQEKFK